jgi:hypothetical protein
MTQEKDKQQVYELGIENGKPILKKVKKKLNRRRKNEQHKTD